MGSWYSLAGPYSFNSTGTADSVKRTGTGAYTVWFPNIPDLGSTVQVTAYGAGDAYCKVGFWTAPSDGASGTDVDVRCFDRSGGAADSTFTISQAFRGVGAGADVRANGVGSASTLYQYSSTGAHASVSSGSTGVYTVRLPGLGGAGGHVRVTGYGTDSRWCKAGGWGPDPGLSVARVADRPIEGGTSVVRQPFP